MRLHMSQSHPHLNYHAMSHAKTSPAFIFPGRPWEYTHEDVAAIARESGIVDESAIAFECGPAMRKVCFQVSFGHV